MFAGLVAVVLLLAGCASEGGAPPDPGPTTSTVAPPVLDIRDSMGRIFAVTAGSEPASAVVEDESLMVRATLGSAEQDLRISAPEGAVWEVLADSSAVLQDPNAPSGQTGGFNAPSGQDAAGSRIRMQVSGTSVVSISPRTRADTQFPIDVQVQIALRALERAEWAENLEGGRSLQVFPSPWGRSGSQAATAAVWKSVTALEPEAETDVMDKQLRCHALGAPDKESWNLEPWRPDVPYIDYLLARCNPT